MVTGNIRHYAASIEKLKHVCDARKGEPIFGMTMMVFKGRTVLVADTNVEDFPSSERLVAISKSCVRVSKLFGFEPKVAFLSHSTFGKPISRNTKHVRDAIDLLKNEKLSLDDKFIISEKAWRLSTAGYSSMFVMVGDEVSVENLLKGIIIASGNDACVALLSLIHISEPTRPY